MICQKANFSVQTDRDVFCIAFCAQMGNKVVLYCTVLSCTGLYCVVPTCLVFVRYAFQPDNIKA